MAVGSSVAIPHGAMGVCSVRLRYFLVILTYIWMLILHWIDIISTLALFPCSLDLFCRISWHMSSLTDYTQIRQSAINISLIRYLAAN